MAVILAPIGGFIMAHPMATAAGVTAINAINYVFPGLTESAIGLAGSMISNGVSIVATPFIKGGGQAFGGAVVDTAEAVATGVFNRVDQRLNQAGKYFEKNKLAPVFGEKNLPTDPNEYVDITQLAFRRASDFVVDHHQALSSLAGGTLTAGGVYLAQRAYELHQDEKASLRDKVRFTATAGMSLLGGSYLLGRAILG